MKCFEGTIFDLETVIQESFIQFQCPISRELIEDPVLASDGFTYDKEPISKWLRNGNTSPMTGIRLPNQTMCKNRVIQGLISRFKKLSAQCFVNFEKSLQITKQKHLQLDTKDNIHIEEDINIKDEKKSKEDNIQGINSVETIRLQFQKGMFGRQHYIQKLESLLKDYPGCQSIIFSIVGSAIDEGNLSRGQNYLNLMKRRFPKSLVPLYLEIELLYKKGLKQKALDKYYYIISHTLLEEHTLIDIRALIYEINLLGNSSFNKTLINGLSTIFPENFFFVGWKICSCIEMEQNKEALEVIERYLSLFGADGQVLYNRAIIMESLDKSKCINAWSDYINIQNGIYLSTAFQRRGLLKGEINDPSFVDDLLRAQELDGTIEIDLPIIKFYYCHRELEKAEKWADCYIKSKSSNHTIQGIELYAAIKEKKYKISEAIDAYNALISLNPSNSFKYYMKINCLCVANLKNQNEKVVNDIESTLSYFLISSE